MVPGIFLYMRYRLPIALTAIVIATIVMAFSWRRVFPFRDGLAEFLPKDTIAYVHVNFTWRTRRALLAHLERFRDGAVTENSGREKLLPALETVLRSPDVRELGLVWFQPDRYAPLLALIIGQRASSRPDILTPTSFTISGTELRFHVVRVNADQNSAIALFWSGAAGGGTHHLPVQATLRPRALPIPAIAAATHLLPETFRAAGTLDRRGFIVRSNSRLPRLSRGRRIALLAPLSVDSVQVLGFPIRAALVEIVAPTHRKLLSALISVMPPTGDAAITRDGSAIRLPNTDPTRDDVQGAIRAVVARLFPSAHRRTLDGLLAETSVADPASITIAPTDDGRWTIRSGGRPIVFVERAGDGVAIATNNMRIARDTPSFRIPSGCADAAIKLIARIHPQLVAIAGFNEDGRPVSVCGGNWGN